MLGWSVSGRRLAAACLVAAACALPSILSAHEIPNDVTIQSFVRAEGAQLRLLVRVPLIAMRDMTWRYKAQDVLDLDRSSQALHDAATLWVGDDVSVWEGDSKLEPQTLVAVRASPSEDRSFETYEAATALLTYLQGYIEKKRQEPGDDVLGRILALEGDQAWSNEELLGFVFVVAAVPLLLTPVPAPLRGCAAAPRA